MESCGNAGASKFHSTFQTFAALETAKESKLRKAIQDLGYSKYLEMIAMLTKTVLRIETCCINTGSKLVMKVGLQYQAPI